MKLLLVTLISTTLFFVVLCEKDEKETEMFKGIHEKCLNDAGPNVKMETIDDASNSKEFKCYLKCMFLASGALNDSGDLITEKLKWLTGDEFKPDVVEQMFEGCKNINDDDQCEKVYKFTKCLVEAKKKIKTR